MEPIIEIRYNKERSLLKISCDGNVFDSSRIESLPPEQWIFPFFAKGIRWNGLYEELRSFAGSGSFGLHFDGDADSFEIIREAFVGTLVEPVNMSKTVTIVYHENPVATKVILDGRIWDAELILNRYIDEWIRPFQVSGISWDGIFQELKKAIGTDNYTIYFVGSRKYMGLLMENCPDTISIFYRNTQMVERTAQAKKTADTPVSAVPDAQPRPESKTPSRPAKSRWTDMAAGKTQFENSLTGRHIMTGFAVCSVVLLFLPFVKFTVVPVDPNMVIQADTSVVSGFEAIFGIPEIRIGMNRSVLAVIMLAAPLLIIASNYIGQLEKFRSRIAVAAPVCNIVFTVIALFDIKRIYYSFDYIDSQVR